MHSSKNLNGRSGICTSENLQLCLFQPEDLGERFQDFNFTSSDNIAVANTDPRTPQGEAWLRREFQKIVDNVQDPQNIPPQDVLERIISGDLKPIAERSVLEVYWEHILLRYIGDVELDIQRNYSPDLHLSLIGTTDRILHGHPGIRESARILNELLPTTQYTIADSVISANGWVTERWGYLDQASSTMVLDGIDTFLIVDGQIKVKMINYNVGPALSQADYENKLGIHIKLPQAA